VFRKSVKGWEGTKYKVREGEGGKRIVCAYFVHGSWNKNFT